MRNDFILIFAVSAFLSATGSFACADTIILKDGRRIEGIIQAEQQNCYIMKIKVGTTKINKDMVQEVKKLSFEENFVNLGNQFLDSQDYKSALEQYKKALDFNPDFQPAKDAIAKTEKIINEIKQKEREEAEKKQKELQEKEDTVTKGFGLRLEVAGDQLKISSIIMDTSAAAMGLKEKDQIIQINDWQTKGKSLEEVINYLINNQINAYTFIIQREANLVRKKIEYQKRTFVGVGTFLDTEGENLVINSVIAGEPADSAGLKPKDRVISINDKSTKGISIDDASALIGGTENSTVKIVIQRSVELERK